jgi:GDP-4-dehydro-6-deoxy-D-mannose reductase
MTRDYNRVLLLGGTGFIGTGFRATYKHKLNICTSGSEVDVRDLAAIDNVVQSFRPDAIVNMASLSTLSQSDELACDVYEINITGCLNIVKSILNNNNKIRLVYISSSQVYGAPDPEQLPLSENSEINPLNKYGIAKYSSECLLRDYHNRFGLDALIARQFNCVGAGQDQRFMISDFVKQVVQNKLDNATQKLHVGNLDTTRDYIDIKDAVSAYKHVIDNGRSGETYNVCSGVETATGDIIKYLEELVGDIEVVKNTSRARCGDIMRVLGDNSKIRLECGFEVNTSLRQSVREVYKYWETQLSG